MTTANMIPRSTMAQRCEIRVQLIERELSPWMSTQAHQPLFEAAGVVCPPGEFITTVLREVSKNTAHRLLTTLRERF